MDSFLNQTITVRSFLSSVAIIATLLLSGTTVFWTIQVNAAIEREKSAHTRVEFNEMKAQLNRIEGTLGSLKGSVAVLQNYHAKD
jgi:hypothetical protein